MAAREDAQICASSPNLQHVESARKVRGVAPLGTLAKSVDADDLKRRRRARLALQDRAAKLLPGERVAACQRRPTGPAVAVHLVGGKACVTGLQQCGSVWHCPVCSRIISAERRDELNCLLAWARRQELMPVMLTLTGRHRRTDTLSRLMSGMKGAKRRLHQSRGWRDVVGHITGHVTATEITHGQHGWHLHFHMILLLDDRGTDRALYGLREDWERALQREGLDCNDHGFDLQDASRAGDYVAKWGAAEELTLSGCKVSKGDKGRTPWQLLVDAEADTAAARLWQEYGCAFKGRRQLVWSRGLKAAARIDEKSDAEIIESERPDMSGDSTEIARLTAAQWRSICRIGLRTELIEAAERQGRAGVERIVAANGGGVMPP